MPDHPITASSVVPPIILHGRRLRLSPVQARLLAVLLAQSGRVVADTTLLATLEGDRARLMRCMSRIRPKVVSHGLVIYREGRAGYLVLERGKP